MTRHFGRATTISIFVFSILGNAAGLAQAAGQGERIRVVITTGGHGFDRKGFFAMWDSFPAIVCRESSQTKTSEAFTATNLAGCDVLVMYDMMANVSDEEKAALLAFVRRGGGLVVLHHTICSRQQWPEFERIIGGKFLGKPEVRDGRELLRSVATGGVKFRIHIADPRHPITEGMSDFEVNDEPYAGMVVDPKVRVLLSTDEPKSNKEIAWARQEGNARIVFLQLGHDNKTYSNPSYRRLVERAVLWAAGRIGR